MAAAHISGAVKSICGRQVAAATFDLAFAPSRPAESPAESPAAESPSESPAAESPAEARPLLTPPLLPVLPGGVNIITFTPRRRPRRAHF